MRYYRLEIANADGAPGAVYTSFVNGGTDPGALQIEFDCPSTVFATPIAQGAWIKVSGVPLESVSQASDLNGKGAKLYGGFQAGLPLANPNQIGLLAQGTIFQAYGNWVGTEQSIEIVIRAGTGSNDDPKNFVWQCAKGATLASAISTTLRTALPGFTATINVSPQLVANEQDTGAYASLTEFANHLKTYSQSIIGGTYPGISVAVSGNAISVYDGTTQSDAVQLAFSDLIGQPTWIGPATIQVNLAMRGDLSVGSYVRMPLTIPNSTAAAALPGAPARTKSAFLGVFQIILVRHVGSYRNPSGQSWITTIDAVTVNG